MLDALILVYNPNLIIYIIFGGDLMNNKPAINALSLGLTYAGCFFGAGYVSGQELWQFFGSFGTLGIIGMILAILLFFIFGVILVRAVQISGKTKFDEVIISGEHNILRNILGLITVFLMFGIIVIMSAGAGSLLNQIFDLPQCLGCAVFGIAICIVGIKGVSGIVKVFSYFIPFLVIATLIICISAICKYGINIDNGACNDNPMLLNWWFSAINYVSYNIITLIGTIIPIAALVKKKSTAYNGIFFGCMCALLLALGILFALSGMQYSVETELPMLDVAFVISPIFGYIYAVLLLLAMFGTALASLVAIIEYGKVRIPIINMHPYIAIITVGIVAFVFSLAGFGTLVGTVYPAFGYIGFIVITMIIYSFIRLKIKR